MPAAIDQIIEFDGITLDTQEYPLVSSVEAGGLQKRSWSMQLKAQATKREARPDVRPGEIEGEWGIAWDDFSQGITGDLENRVGAVHIAENVNCYEKGHVRPVGYQEATALTGGGGRELNPMMFNNIQFFPNGQYMDFYSGSTLANDEDFGAGVLVTAAIVHNNELVVGFDGSTNSIRTRNTAGTWTTATDATYAGTLTHVEDRLWRHTATNQVSNCGPTDQPRTLSVWSAGIPIGDNAVGITALGAIGEQLVVAKPDSVLLGDRNAIFGNVLPGIVTDPRNGIGMLTLGADVFYPHRSGILHYAPGAYPREIGVQQHFKSAEFADTLPGLDTRALATDGHYLYAICQTSGYPQVKPTSIKRTTNSGTSYTTITANLTDDDPSSTSNISLGTIAGGTWVVVGYSTAAFYALQIDLMTFNSIAATLRVEYWDGAAWTNIPTTGASTALRDETDASTLAAPLTPAGAGVTLARAGSIYWLSNLSSTTIDGVTAYWVRLSASVATSTSVNAAEIRIPTGTPQIWCYRTDLSKGALTWEYVGRTSSGSINAYSPGGAAIFDQTSPFSGVRGPRLTVLVASNLYSQALGISDLDVGQRIDAGGSNYRLTTARHDGGTPELNKQWLAITIKGRGIDANRDLQLEYRNDFASAWTTAAASITASPTTTALTGITGRSIQIRVQFNAFTTQPFPELLEIEAVYRELPTMKREWNYLVKIPKNGYNGTPPETMLTNLENLRTAVAFSHDDPYRRRYTVNCLDIGVAERYQDGEGVPVLAVPIRIVEV